jgi:hypothetical protein
VAGAQRPLAALLHLRAEQRGMGLSGKMDGRGNSYARHKNEEARKKNELAFCRVSERERIKKHPMPIYFRHLLAPLSGWSQQIKPKRQIADIERDRARSTPADDSLDKTNLFYTWIMIFFR